MPMMNVETIAIATPTTPQNLPPWPQRAKACQE
jgi:hypothetical protein